MTPIILTILILLSSTVTAIRYKKFRLDFHHSDVIDDSVCYYYQVYGTKQHFHKIVIFPSCPNDAYDIISNVVVSKSDVSVIQDADHGVGIEMTKMENKMVYFCVNIADSIILDDADYCIFKTKSKSQCIHGLNVPDICDIKTTTIQPIPPPTLIPTMQPVPKPTIQPTKTPTNSPTAEPTTEPTNAEPTDEPIPGQPFKFEHGNFTLRNTTTIIRPSMIQSCSVDFVELYTSEIDIDSIMIGSAMISLLPYINDMPDACPVLRGCVETIEHISLSVARIRLGPLNYSALYSEANIFINGTGTIYKLINETFDYNDTFTFNDSDTTSRRLIGSEYYSPIVFNEDFYLLNIPAWYTEKNDHPATLKYSGITVKFGLYSKATIFYTLTMRDTWGGFGFGVFTSVIHEQYLRIFVTNKAVIGMEIEDPDIKLAKEYTVKKWTKYFKTMWLNIGSVPFTVTPFFEFKWGFDIIKLSYGVTAEMKSTAQLGFHYKEDKTPKMEPLYKYSEKITIKQQLSDIVTHENSKKSCQFDPKVYIKPTFGVIIEGSLYTVEVPIEAGIKLELKLPTQICPDCTKEYQYGIYFYAEAKIEIKLFDFRHLVGDSWNGQIEFPLTKSIPLITKPIIGPNCSDLSTFGETIKNFISQVCCPTSGPTKWLTPGIDPTIDPAQSSPSTDPTRSPSTDPTLSPSTDPTLSPSTDPTIDPTRIPTEDPTSKTTIEPTYKPTRDPTYKSTRDPTTKPPTIEPTMEPTIEPTAEPTKEPTKEPTIEPTFGPTMKHGISAHIKPFDIDDKSFTYSQWNSFMQNKDAMTIGILGIMVMFIGSIICLSYVGCNKNKYKYDAVDNCDNH